MKIIIAGTILGCVMGIVVLEVLYGHGKEMEHHDLHTSQD